MDLMMFFGRENFLLNSYKFDGSFLYFQLFKYKSFYESFDRGSELR